MPEICQEHASQKILSIHLDFSQNPHMPLCGKPMLNKGHKGGQHTCTRFKEIAQDSISGCFYPKRTFILGLPAFNQVWWMSPKLTLQSVVSETQIQMFLHLPNEEPTPYGCLWREPAAISLIKPLWKLLQQQTDELSKADLLAEDEWKSSLGILTVYKASFLLGWPLTLAHSGWLILLPVTAGSLSQSPAPSLSRSSHQDQTNLPALSYCE